MQKLSNIFGRLGNQMFQGAYIYAQMKRGEIPDIYVQDPKYFDEYRDDIRKLYGDGIIKSDYVAIHVRRGDYVNNPFYVDLMKTDYYQKSMAQFPDAKFLVFSDDPAFVGVHPLFKDCFKSVDNDEIRALNRMAGCKGIIMANSSFSWWASYLSDAKVIAPKAWYTDGIERTRCPINWLRI